MALLGTNGSDGLNKHKNVNHSQRTVKRGQLTKYEPLIAICWPFQWTLQEGLTDRVDIENLKQFVNGSLWFDCQS